MCRSIPELFYLIHCFRALRDIDSFESEVMIRDETVEHIKCSSGFEFHGAFFHGYKFLLSATP